MKNKTKKGFTIVELVIVIAVIGILAAVLIPMFSGLINKAYLAADESMVRNINNQLAIAEVQVGKNPTMHEALLDAQDAGYIVENINAKSRGNLLVWDQTLDRVALIEKETGNVIAGEVSDANNKVALWQTAESYTAGGYSIYLKNGYNGSATISDVNTGIDVGYNKNISSISYVSNSSQSVVIRTNSYSTVLTIDAEHDTVTHYGKASKVDVTAVDNSHCYNEHGDIAGNINLEKGKVVVHKDCSAGAVVIDMTAAELATVTTLSADNSANKEVPIILNTSEVLWSANPHNGLISPTTNNIIYSSTGGTLPENFDTMTDEQKEAAIATASEELVQGVAAVQHNTYDTWQSAWESVQNGQIIRLLANVSTGKTISIINKEITLDLNGHICDTSASSDGFTIKEKAKLILKDSSKNETSEIRTTQKWGAIYVNGGTFINENANVTSTGNYCVYHDTGITEINGGCISAVKYGICLYTSGTININGGTINASAALITSGNAGSNTREINITGGTFNGSIYKPDGGTLNISGGDFFGETCLYVKGGTVNITGGSFIANAGNGNWKHNGSGFSSTGDAIIVEGCNYPAGNPFINITGGTFAGYNKDGGAEASPDNIYFKNYGILAINYGNNTVDMSGTTVSYRLANIADENDANYMTSNGYMHFTDDNTILVTD